jgi:cytochrome oxidase Cu insertion factor (SCO1/SenC/PrrC family)
MNVPTLPIKDPMIPASWRQRLYLLFIVACFVVPLATAGWLAGRWTPGHTVQHGELLHPARPLNLHFTALDGGSTALQGHWILLYAGSATGCDARCHTALYDLRQVRLALGKDMQRVETVLLLGGAPDAALRQWLVHEHAAMRVGIVDVERQNRLMEAFDHTGVIGDWIYLIDPLGNLVMRYPATVEPRGMLKDLQRLLKWSRIG